MGCGASASTPKPDQKVDDAQESTSWAVKCNQEHPGKSSTSSLKGPVGTTPVNAQQNQNVVLVDADDDDEIEIIQEQAPKQQPRSNSNREDQHNLQMQMLAAANGQEPPEAAEEPRAQQPQQPPAKPLSKEQQAEAAYLAERRKQFDNKRYERANDDGGYPQAGYNTNVKTNSDVRPSTDMILGLNVSQQPRNSNHEMNAFLPGGILDDVDDYRPEPMSKKKIKSHDDIESTGFDADDEALMKEILEDFD